MTITLIGAGGSGRSRAAAASICSMFSRPRPPVISARALFNPIIATSSSMYAGSRSGLIQRRYPPNGSNSRAAQVEQRHVVIAGHDNLRERQAAEKRGRLLELPPPRALRQIAGHRDQIGMDRRDAFDQRRDDALVEAAEMQIGKMDDRAHGVSPQAQAPSARRATIDSEAAWQASALRRRRRR